MAAELPRPGVEVIQVFRTVTPTVVTPTLVPCVVGVGKQIVDLIEQDASGSSVLNGDALIQLPAFFLSKAASGSTPVFTGLDGLDLVVSANNGAAVTTTFVDAAAAGLTPPSVVSQVNAALLAAGVTSAVAETVGTTQWRLRTVGVGEFQSLYIDPATSPAVLTAFAFGSGKTNIGVTQYNQLQVDIPPTNFPDPRGNLEELAVESSTIRMFLAITASNFQEILRTESFLRNGTVNAPAQLVGTVDLTTLTLPGDVTGLTFLITVDGGAEQTVNLTAASTTPTNLIGEINTGTTGLVATLDGSNHLVVTADSTGDESTLELGAGSANTVLGFTTGQSDVGENIAVVDDGNGDNYSALLQFTGYDFTAVGAVAVVTGSVDMSGLSLPGDLTGKTLVLSDGQQAQTLVFDATNAANQAAVLAAINSLMAPAAGGKITATATGGNNLVLTHSDSGAQSLVYVVGGTAASVLGLTVGRTYGAPSHVDVGDELWVDGARIGIITQVSPGGSVDTLKLDSLQVLTTNFGESFYIVAKNLSASPGVDRPYPDLIVDANMNVFVKHSLLRDTEGNPLELVAAKAAMYLTYTAVRRDLSRAASNPGLLRFDSQEQLEASLSPINTLNPLALGLFFALVNAPGVQVTGLGVDAISADSPFGTVEAFQRAAEFLEAFEVYAIAPLTHDQTVGQIFNTHVSFMSEPEQKGERIVLWNPVRPANELDKLVASGASGDSYGSAGTQFDTKVPNLAALLLAQGVNPVGTIATSSGVFLDLASDSKNYSISAISGSIVTIRTTFGAGDNDDGFYSTTDLNDPPLPTLLIGESFAVKVRGVPLLLEDNTPDKQAIAETYQELGQSFKNRRFWMTAPDTAAATVQGLEQLVNGFYVNAATAGMIGQQPPQQSFTNFPVTGFTRVLGSSDFFSERQLNIMAAGGTYVYIQDGPQLPIISRHALTTDLTSIETRTDSITKVVDFVAKLLRRGLKNFIGRFNITQAFIDQLGSVVSGLGGLMVETGVLIGFNLNNIVQDEDAPDTVLVDVLLDVPYPANYIRVTLVI